MAVRQVLERCITSVDALSNHRQRKPASVDAIPDDWLQRMQLITGAVAILGAGDDLRLRNCARI